MSEGKNLSAANQLGGWLLDQLALPHNATELNISIKAGLPALLTATFCVWDASILSVVESQRLYALTLAQPPVAWRLFALQELTAPTSTDQVTLEELKPTVYAAAEQICADPEGAQQ